MRFSMKTWSNCDDQCSRRNGVANSDGDGTVPLVSLGYMCVKVSVFFCILVEEISVFGFFLCI